MDLLRDLRFAARLLIKDRWFTLMAVVVLALGIGANNAVFTIVNAVLLRNLPVPKPDRNNNQERDPDAVAYIPHRQNTSMARAATVLARTRANPAQATRILREAITAVDPDQALSSPRTMDDALAQQRWLLRVFTTMFAAFAVIALVLAAVGLSIGLAAAFAGGRVLQSFLVQTSTHDPVTLVSIVVLLTVVAVAACIGPVRRATRLDPLRALRHD